MDIKAKMELEQEFDAVDKMGDTTRRLAFQKLLLQSSSYEPLVRERACFVLGWIGTSRDLSRLRKLSLEEPEISVRRWSGTQQLHIHARFPQAKQTVLKNLALALVQEEEPEVLKEHILAAQEILKRRFGISGRMEAKQVAEIEAAATKARKALDKYLT